MKRTAPSEDAPVSPPAVKRKVTSTTTNKAVSSFFKPSSEKEPDKLTWKIVQNSLVVGKFCDPAERVAELQRPVKIAAFDLDDTIIAPNSGNRFNRSANSWKWWHSTVPQRLKELHDSGHLVVIISNQMGISLKENAKLSGSDSASLKNFKDQLKSISNSLDFPFIVYAATGGDRYRKPRPGMWEQLKEDCELKDKNAIDMKESFFVGDAAGRDKTDKRKKDHSVSDRDFAANAGIKFHTPEEFFLDHEVEPYSHLFEPKQFLESTNQKQNSETLFKKKDLQEIVIFCGSPGAGKSSYFWRHMQPLGYERINQDNLKTRERCIKAARQHLEDSMSVVVDNTNRDKETRRHWVKLAQEFKIPIRCVHFTASTRLAEHNDAVRGLHSDVNPEARVILPAIAFRSFADNFQKPELDEGFTDITTVDFKFEGSDAEKETWSKYWVSKFST